MGKKHASQYANFGWLQNKVLGFTITQYNKYNVYDIISNLYKD